MNVPAWVRWLLGGTVAGIAAAQQIIPMPPVVHGALSVGLVVFAALGIVPPHYEISDEK
jgi:hypothetical protein